MIRDLVNRKNLPALTSDHWHVVHARPAEDPSLGARFVRSIVSEHEDRAAAAAAARKILSSLAPTMAGRPREGRDQIFVRRPEFKSLKIAKRVTKPRK